MTADRSALLRDALTPGSTDATIRAYLAEAPDVELVLDGPARAGLVQHANRTLRVVIATLAETDDGRGPWHPADALASGDLTDAQQEAVARWEDDEAERWAR
jgi:hypothetical protein